MNAQPGLPALSFLAAGDLATYVRTFQGVVGAGGTRITGDAARQVLMQSRLPVGELGRIWELSDLRKQGSLSLPEFALAMFLAQSRIRGKVLPDVLPPAILAEIQAANALPPAVAAPQAMLTPQMALAPQQRAMSTQMSMAPPPPASMPAMRAGTSPPAGADLDDSFESRFPELGGATGPLRKARQSFHQSMLAPPASQKQQQSQQPQQQWAISAQERAQYEAIFRQCDPTRTGVIRGGQAREVFAQSSLAQHELAKIWALADSSNQGELNLDEFSVAMHLIFRRLAGAPIPDKLPADLVPRSTRGFMDSLNDMKGQLMFKDAGTAAAARRPVSRTATPMHEASPRQQSVVSPVDSAKNDDGDVYRSANRRRPTDRSDVSTGRNSAEPVTPAGEPTSATAQSLDELRAEVRRRREDVAKLKADIDKRSKEQAEGRVTQRWKVDDLKREIEDIHRTTPAAKDGSGSGSGDGDEERARLVERRRALVGSIGGLLQEIPRLAADYRRLAGDLVEANKEALSKKKQKGAGAAGSGEDVESRAARLVAQRMAALTGQTLDSLDAPDAGETDRIDRQHRERIERVESVTNGLARVQKAVQELAVGGLAVTVDPKWDAGAGLLTEDARDLVRRLQLIPRAAPPSTPPVVQQQPQEQPQQAPSMAQRLAAAATPQERERLLKEIAEERFRERQRALGIPDPAEEEKEEAPKPVASAPPRAPSPPPAAKVTPFISQPAPAAAKPEMSQRADDADLLGLTTGGVDESLASNPFSAAPKAADVTERRAYADIFSQSLERDDYSDSSSDNEWDRDDSSDDDGGAAPDAAAKSTAKVVAALAAVADEERHAAPADKDGAESSNSSVSFNTAFAQPAAAGAAAAEAPAAAPAAAPVPAAAKDETNPFLGLLSMDASKASESGAAAPTAAAAAEHKVERVRALYPYSAEDSDATELRLETGMLIETRAVPADAAGAHAGAGWMYGELLREEDSGDGWAPSGTIGWFPAEYAETLGAPGSRGWDKTRARFGAAKYDYEPQNEDELKVNIGDRVRVVDGDPSESWWKVRHFASRAVGMLPAIYIELDK